MRLGPLVVPDWVLVVFVCLLPVAFMVTRSFGRANPITLDIELTGTIDSYRTLLSGVCWRPGARPSRPRGCSCSTDHPPWCSG